jgi:hypothetical protein
MEVITPVKVNYDEIAMRVFVESINLLGGLKKVVEFRNLTWVPSLTEAAYAIVMKKIGMKTDSEIAKELGITEQTVKNILHAEAEEVEKYIKGEIDKVDEHVAGGLAKLAFEKLKQEDRLETITELSHSETKTIEEVFDIEILWAFRVLKSLKGLHFPAEKEQLEERLRDIEIKGKSISQLLDKIEYPVKSPAELLHKLKEASEQG